MATIRRVVTNELLFEDEKLSLKELVVKNKLDLVYADLRDADLSFVDFIGADLSCADLRGANLIGADLRSAKLLGTNF